MSAPMLAVIVPEWERRAVSIPLALLTAFERDLIGHATRKIEDLDKRLTKGWQVIDECIAAGRDARRYEDHWIALLAEYETAWHDRQALLVTAAHRIGRDALLTPPAPESILSTDEH